MPPHVMTPRARDKPRKGEALELFAREDAPRQRPLVYQSDGTSHVRGITDAAPLEAFLLRHADEEHPYDINEFRTHGRRGREVDRTAHGQTAVRLVSLGGGRL